MKKFCVLFVGMLLAFTLVGCDACKETVFTKMGDSLATLGKSGLEKDQVLASRKADRAGKCAQQQGGALKKNLGL